MSRVCNLVLARLVFPPLLFLLGLINSPVLDDGRLTDGQGRVVDFRNCVIVQTRYVNDMVLQD